MNAIKSKVAYSKIGKMIATVVRNRYYKTSRVSWVQQAWIEGRMHRLPK